MMSNVHLTYEIESYLQHLSLATYWHSDLLCQVTPEYWQKMKEKYTTGTQFSLVASF